MRLCRPSLLLLLAVLVTGCGLDPAETASCLRVIAAFEPDADGVEILRQASDPAASNGIVLEYRTADGVERWVNCRFSLRRVENAPLELAGVATSREGILPEMRLFWLSAGLRWSQAPRFLRHFRTLI